MNAPGIDPLRPDTVTITSVAPAACAPVVALIDVADSTTTFVAATPPSDTAAPVAKLLPLMRTAVPPAAGPTDGVTAVTIGSVDVGVLGVLEPPHDPTTTVSAISAMFRNPFIRF